MADQCALSVVLQNSTVYQSVQWIQTFLSLTAIIFVIYATICHLNVSRTIFDGVTLWYIKTLFAMIAVYSIGIGATQVASLTAHYTAQSPCDAHFPKVLCIFRMIAASVTPSSVLIHTSLTVQQALSTFQFSLRAQKFVARSAISVMLFYVIIFGVLSYLDEAFTGEAIFCSSFNEERKIVQIVNLNVMMAIDVINFAAVVLLLRYNKKALAGNRSYELSSTFQRVQNVHAMHQFIPVILLHSVTQLARFGLYSFTFYFRPNYTQAEFIIIYAAMMPFYCLLSPLAFLVLTKLGRFRRKEQLKNVIAQEKILNQGTQEAYFNNLSTAWDGPNAK